VKLNKEMLTYFLHEFKDDGKHKLHCIGDLHFFLNIYLERMLLTIGLENTKNRFKLLGTAYDVEE
jgi:hypothetical protein